jgi:uncharacterized protein
MLRPLFIKFQTESGFYILDSGTNEILRVSPVVYAIIDDFMCIEDDAVIKKNSDLYGENKIREAIVALRYISEKRILQTRYYQKSVATTGLLCDQKRYTFDEFLSTFSRMLTLELTQKCNLDCEYCIFGKHYYRHPQRSTDSILVDVAELAIKSHLSKPQSGRTITFYGGEPLLEFDLLRHLILYAEQYCQDIEKDKPMFSLTTNGTLLNDDIIHFLVEHECHVSISLDGDRESHNKYRLYKGSAHGSFDTVEGNMQRFVELYPKYEKRGIILTLTASTNFYQTNEFLKNYISYPAIVINFADSFLGIDQGCLNNECDGNNCAQFSLPLSEQMIPDFLNWTLDRKKQWNNCYHEFQSALLSSWVTAKEDWPLFFRNHYTSMKRYYDRKIKSPCFGRVTCCCIPGAVRLYCDIYGNYYPCERVELRDSFKIGNVWSGIDADKVSNMINYMSDVTECGNCVGKRLCSICPASITETDLNGYSDIRIQEHCRSISDELGTQLGQYVSLMESQPDIFPDSTSNEMLDSDWLSNVFFLHDAQ